VNGPGTITLNLKGGSIPNPSSTNITAIANISNPVHGHAFNVSGRLRIVATGAGLSSEHVVLVFSWSTSVAMVTTNSTGGYSYTAIAPSTPGLYNVDAFFLGDYNGPATPPQYLPSKATAMVTVT
jgi:hypothetical protein